MWIQICVTNLGSLAHSDTAPSATIILTQLRLPLQWRHNEPDGVSNHRRLGCLVNRLFKRRSKETSKFRVTGFCAGNHRWLVDSPTKGPVTRKIFAFDDVIMTTMSQESYLKTGISYYSPKSNVWTWSHPIGFFDIGGLTFLWLKRSVFHKEHIFTKLLSFTSILVQKYIEAFKCRFRTG